MIQTCSVHNYDFCFIYFTINLEGAALCLTWPSESGPRAKIIAHPWCMGMGLSAYGTT